MHEPAAPTEMWRGSPARRNDLLHERLVISCWEDHIWHLFNLGKVGEHACLGVHGCVSACKQSRIIPSQLPQDHIHMLSLVWYYHLSDYNVEVQNAAVSG